MEQVAQTARVAATTTSSPASMTSSAGNDPAGLLGSRVGDREHAQRSGPAERRREPALEQRARRDPQPREQDHPPSPTGTVAIDLRPDRGRREGRCRQVRDASREPDPEALLDADREVRVVQADDDAQVRAERASVEGGRQVDQVVARRRDDRPGRVETELVEDLAGGVRRR